MATINPFNSTWFARPAEVRYRGYEENPDIPPYFPEGKYTLNYKSNPRFANYPGEGILQMYIRYDGYGEGQPHGPQYIRMRDQRYRVQILENSTETWGPRSPGLGSLALRRIGREYIIPQKTLMYLFLHYGLDTEEAWDQVFNRAPRALRSTHLPLLMSIIGATKAHPKPAHKENPYDSDDSNFGKILKPYEKYKIPGNAQGIRFNTRFGVRKLRRSQKGLYIKANNRKFYLHRY